MKNKKAVLGLDTVKTFVLAIMIIAIIVFALIVALASLGNTGAGIVRTDTATIRNETTTNQVNTTGTGLSVASARQPLCSIIYVTNATGGEIITAGNYSQSNCIITFTGGANDEGYNNTVWNVSYSYTSVISNPVDVTTNTSSGVVSLMSNVGTWFSLLAIVVIILIIAVVIIAVNRFGTQGGGL